MRRTRVVAVLIACLAAVAPLVGTAAAMNPNPNKPVVEIIDVTFPAPNLSNECGFPVEAHVAGTFSMKILQNGVAQIKIRYDHTFSGPGGSFTVNHTENLKSTIVYSDDGSFVETVHASGTLLYHTVIPGYGVVANNSGLEVLEFSVEWDEDLQDYVVTNVEIFADTGPNDEISDEEFDLLCGILG